MSIVDTFDPIGTEIVKAENNVTPIENFPKTMLIAFSAKFCSLFLQNHAAEEIGCLKAGGTRFPIYRFSYKGREIGFFQSMIGSSLAAAFLEELIALGGEKFLYFGSCGALDKEIAEGNLLIPSTAYRDEGTSYHYAAPSDYLQILSAPKLAQIFTELHVPFRTTKTWTTDAFYRETSRNLDLRRQEGCNTVEMECAALMAVGQFRKKEVYQFFYAADCLDAQAWDKRMLGQMPADLRGRILAVALETAVRL